MRSRMIVRRPAAVAAEVVLPMAVAMAVEHPLLCAPIRAMFALVRQRLHLSALLQQPPWRRKLLPNRLSRNQLSNNPLLSSRTCLQDAPVGAVQQQVDQAVPASC